MALLDVRIFPDPVLREECSPVNGFTGELAQLLDDMKETMYQENGIGLAAPQVGETIRATVVDVSEDGSDLIELVNPVIIASEGQVSSEEGCLSIPDYRDTVVRDALITVEAFDREGTKFTLEAEGILSICIQHEIDHLDGVLFVDRLSRLKRDMFKRWLKKQRKIQ